MGRPTIFDRPMTAAERQRRSREMRKSGHVKPPTRAEQAAHAGVTERAWLYRIKRNRVFKFQPFTVERIEHKVARTFIEKHHYSRICPTGRSVHFGAFVDGKLYAVVTYGNGANADGGASLARMTGLPVTRQNHLVLTRLCRRGGKHRAKIAMSSFLAKCHRVLKREHGVRFVVSYADPIMNGTTVAAPRSTPWQAGGIYAAANFRYLGKVPAERHFRDRSGRFVHRRVPYRLMKRRNEHGRAMTMPEAQRMLGLTPWRMPPKERWFVNLGHR